MSTLTVTSAWTSAQWSLLQHIAGGGQVTVTRQGHRRAAHGAHPAATCGNLDQLADWHLITLDGGRAQITDDGRRALLDDTAGAADA